MDIAVSMKLPVETINQAASYFLYKEPDWQQSLVLVYEGKNARIYRPNINLYISLKRKRLTESDLQDCLAMIDFAIENKESIQKKQLIKALTTDIDHEKNESKRERLVILKKRLEAL